MLLRREHHHGKRRLVYGFAGIVALMIGGVWVAQMGFLFQTAGSDDFKGNFLKFKSDIESGMEYGNSQIGSQYPEMTKTPGQKLDEMSAATESNIKTREALSAAAQAMVERLNASANAEEGADQTTPSDEGASPNLPAGGEDAAGTDTATQ